MTSELDGARPVILAVDDDPDVIALIGDELTKRYGGDYRVITARAASAALSELERLRVGGERVALVLADQWLPGSTTGTDLLTEACGLHPHAKRVLLISWGDWSVDATAGPLRKGIGLGHIDYYMLKPWRAADELFHRTITEFLHEWAGGDSAARELTVVADAESARGHELRSLLAHNRVPFAFFTSDSPDGRRILEDSGQAGASVPIVVRRNGLVLVDPTDQDVAEAYGVRTRLHGSREFDVAVVGAGPAGLSAAVYAASEGLRTVVIERRSIGGQSASSSRIRNYMGFQRGISGAELAQRAYQQAWVFGTSFILMCQATAIRSDGERHAISLSNCSDISVGAVVLAMGVSYRTLDVPALEPLTGAGVFYGASVSEAERFTGARVFVVGAGNSAGQAAVHLSRFADRVTIVCRGDDLAKSMSRYLIDEINSNPVIDVRFETRIVDGSGTSRLESLTLRDPSGDTTEEADAVFVLIGAHPLTDWLPEEIARDRFGFVLTGAADSRWTLERPPFMFESTVPGVFAVGDVRSGSVKRVASAAGEGSVAIQQVHQYLDTLTPAH